MTLKEACESGKPFRHKTWGDFYTKEEAIRFEKITSIDEAISDDWEIQQKETFTREDVERAVIVAWNSSISKTASSGNLVNEMLLERVIEEAMKAAEGNV